MCNPAIFFCNPKLHIYCLWWFRPCHRSARDLCWTEHSRDGLFNSASPLRLCPASHKPTSSAHLSSGAAARDLFVASGLKPLSTLLLYRYKCCVVPRWLPRDRGPHDGNLYFMRDNGTPIDCIELRDLVIITCGSYWIVSGLKSQSGVGLSWVRFPWFSSSRCLDITLN